MGGTFTHAVAIDNQSLERNLVNPSQSELAALRSEAEQAVIRMGADPDTVEVQIEIDAQRNLVRAVATGSVAFVAQDLLQQVVSEEERLKPLREAAPREQEVVLKGQTDTLYLYESERKEKFFLNPFGQGTAMGSSPPAEGKRIRAASSEPRPIPAIPRDRVNMPAPSKNSVLSVNDCQSGVAAPEMLSVRARGYCWNRCMGGCRVRPTGSSIR